MNNILTRALLSAMVPIAVLLIPPAVCGLGPFDQGVQAYNSGKLPLAMVFFSESVGLNPSNAYTHYYLANTLLRMGRHVQAIEEYQRCLQIDPGGKIGQYADAALKNYQKVLIKQAAVASSDK